MTFVKLKDLSDFLGQVQGPGYALCQKILKLCPRGCKKKIWLVNTQWIYEQVAQASRPLIKAIKMWGSVKALARGIEYMMGIAIFTPVAVLAWFPFVSEFQTRLLFNQAFSRGLQIQRILAGGKKNK
ncbi:callose synthase 5 [Euphorbia peplus]|nr:callose synthase 5 [Euphorbia peplus]